VRSETITSRAWLIALAIVALGVALRLPGMLGWWVNPDEGTYFSMVTWDEWSRFWQEVAAHAHPPLYYVLLRLVGFLTHDISWLRSVALISGSIAIFLAWLVGRELGERGTVGTVAGLFAALIVAISPGAILMSQIMRPYSLQLVFFLAAFLALLRYRRESGIGDLVLYSVGLSLALLTHYSSIFVLATFGALIGFDLIAGKLERRLIPQLLLAHLGPALILVGLYLFHLRPHLLDSRLASEALEVWLEHLMIDSVADVWLNLLGFFGYLVGSWLAGPALLVFLVGVGVALWRRSWSLAVLSLVAIGISVFAAAVGKYPFGSCRQSTWLIGFLVFPLAWAPALALTSRRRVAVGGLVVLLVLVGLGPQVGALMGAEQTQLEPNSEQVLSGIDLASVTEVFKAVSEPGLLLLSHQSYYLLVPFFETERQSAVRYPESNFFRFRWGARDVLVSEEWEFTLRPEELDEDDHLFNFVLAVDRELPELVLPEQRRVLMFFGGWSTETPNALQSANRQLPPESPLARPLAEVEGFRALEVDLATFQASFAKLVEAGDSNPSP